MNVARKAVAIAWFRKEDYARILDISDDADTLPRDFDKWREEAEAGKRELESGGLVVIPTIIDPAALSEWAKSRGLNINAQARAEFVLVLAREKYGS